MTDKKESSCCASQNNTQMPESSEQQSPEQQSPCCSSGSKRAQNTRSACCSTAKETVSSCCSSDSTTVSEKPSASSCCGTNPAHENSTSKAATSCCDSDGQKKTDWILWGSSAFVILMVALSLSPISDAPQWLTTMTNTSVEMLHAMWWGVALGIVLVGWLNRIPREVVISALGPGHTKRGIFRATLAGLLLDLCNHGILMVAMKLYERGASLGQVMAFLIASPWNSFTLTLILFGLIGVSWTLAFIAFSMIIAWICGMIFDRLELKGTLPMNPYKADLPEDFKLAPELKRLMKSADYSPKATLAMFWDGLKGARMVIRWIMFGIVLLAFIRAFVPEDIFTGWFGATVGGLFLTLLAATLIEVCSEGSTPIAADLVNRAGAPGNGFTFLMAGAATDYTEIMVLKDTTKSWKIALYLPLISIPQVLLIGWLMNTFG